MHCLKCLSLAAALAIAALPATAAELPDSATLRAWVAEMKASDRGPFARIRWFCKDGTILPPRPYACGPHGGGSQHGEWTDRVKQLRAGGYSIANILSDLDVEAFVQRPDHKDALNQMLIEQFLVRADDGWILRKARYYRGALQEEGERRGARRLLFKLAEDPDWLTRDYLRLRTAARLLRHGPESASANDVRQQATALANQDAGFKRLRNKIHVSPEAADAADVRAYADKLGADKRGPYEKLAADIDALYAGDTTLPALKAMAQETAKLDDLGAILGRGAAAMEGSKDPAVHLATTASLMATLRERQTRPRTPNTRIGLIDTSLALETEHFAAATRLAAKLEGAPRKKRLAWLRAGVEAVYGAGLISARQRGELAQAAKRLERDQVDLATYKETLQYLGLVPGWSGRWLQFHFEASMHKLADLDPLAELFIQDQLRGSPLFFYAQVLDSLLRDANRLAGVRNELFGVDVGAGLRSLNPGLARGTLSLAEAEPESYREDGIYLLPETIAELPPVAGILTAGEGNPLSHVQLLARNLGIPNVAVDRSLLPELAPAEGKAVVLAVSPAGSVRLAEDNGELDALLGAQGADQDQEVLIKPDVEKLDLSVTQVIALSELRAEDSGRTVGPKAAKLGELRHHFPEAVADGLAIPFGVFRKLLDQPYGSTGQSVYDWMVGQYRKLDAMPKGSEPRRAATEAFREDLHDWIENADAGAAFRQQLSAAMAKVFGPDGSYGVFVRSDTNVEDLPGFTGAGLNLTVPKVVGVANILATIPRVWASPFTARAFAWRQSHMDQPEHVYPAVLLLRSVNADKSGVLVTQDIDSGAKDWLSVAVNEGVGGAVDGQAAESLRIDTASGVVRLLAQATAPLRRQVDPAGGVAKLPVSAADAVLQPAEVERLIALSRELPQRFPAIVDAQGQPAPADIEFGFQDGELRLFQIRPFLESAKARSSDYLKSLDAGMKDLASVAVDLNEIPKE